MEERDSVAIVAKRVDALQELALKIYGRYDKEKSLLWFVEEVGEIVAAVRKQKSKEEIVAELGDVFAWVLCLSNILDCDLSDAITQSMNKEMSRQQRQYGGLKYWSSGS